MRTTIDLPDDLFKAAKLEAVHQGTTLKNLITETLRERLGASGRASFSVRTPRLSPAEREASNSRILKAMKTGMRLGGKPLSREEIHERRPIR